MFDTMTFTKAGAAVCAALLIFLFASWGADALYSTAEESHGGEHAEEGEGPTQGYVIADLSSGEGGEEEAAPEMSFDEMYAQADAGAGERVFNMCRSCHALDGSNGTGPHLDGVVGRAVASVDGYAYSDAMAAVEGDWTPAELDAFLESPRSDVSGTKMTFSGINDMEDRANLIAYLEGAGG